MEVKEDNLDEKQPRIHCRDIINQQSIQKPLINQGNISKFKLYKKNKQQITFRLLNHSEYFITGKIIKIIIRDEIDNMPFIIHIKLKNGEIAIICSWEIDFETIIPSNYNPIRYFIRDAISKDLKEQIFRRDNGECQLKLNGCTKVAEEIDHIIPISKGGLSVIDNLQSACPNCNKKKSNNILI